ncbi:unnamed protein product, partial [Cyprideis torosa]
GPSLLSRRLFLSPASTSVDVHLTRVEGCPLAQAEVYIEDSFSRWRIVPLLPEGEHLLPAPSSLPATIVIRGIAPGQFHRLRVSLINAAGRKDVELEFPTRTLEGESISSSTSDGSMSHPASSSSSSLPEHSSSSPSSTS